MHHVWPLGYHGPNVKSNLVKICPNAHSDIHFLMELMLRGKPYNLSEYGPNVRALAKRGYDAVVAYGEGLAEMIEAQPLTAARIRDTVFP